MNDINWPGLLIDLLIIASGVFAFVVLPRLITRWARQRVHDHTRSGGYGAVVRYWTDKDPSRGLGAFLSTRHGWELHVNSADSRARMSRADVREFNVCEDAGGRAVAIELVAQDESRLFLEPVSRKGWGRAASAEVRYLAKKVQEDLAR